MDFLKTVALLKSARGGGGGSTAKYVINEADYLFYGGGRLNMFDELLSWCKDVTSMQCMFFLCSDLTDLDLSGFDVSKVTSFLNVFNGCHSLMELDLSSWDTSNVSSMRGMFQNCSALRAFDMSTWDTSRVFEMNYMFNGCEVMEEIIGFSAPYKAGITIGFPCGTSSKRYALRRLTFRTDVENAVRSAIYIPYCSFHRNGMVEMFNSLPDVSGLGLNSSDTTITITGNPCVTGGEYKTGAIISVDELVAAIEEYGLQNSIFTAEQMDGDSNLDVGPLSGEMTAEDFESVLDFPLVCIKWEAETLTDEDRAIATSKGWTLAEA